MVTTEHVYANDYSENLAHQLEARRRFRKVRAAVSNNKDGFIWDFLQGQNVSCRTYGVFADKREEGTFLSLKGHECKSFYLLFTRYKRHYPLLSQKW